VVFLSFWQQNIGIRQNIFLSHSKSHKHLSSWSRLKKWNQQEHLTSEALLIPHFRHSFYIGHIWFALRLSPVSRDRYISDGRQFLQLSCNLRHIYYRRLTPSAKIRSPRTIFKIMSKLSGLTKCKIWRFLSGADDKSCLLGCHNMSTFVG
jgi:hypothetical protein